MSSSNRRRREDDGEDDFGDDDDDESNDNDDRAAAAAASSPSSKKPPPAKKRKKAGVSSLIDDAAEESGEENGDDDDEDEDDDDDNNDYLKDGFVVDEEDQEIETKNKDELEDSDDEDDDDDDDADDDEGGGRARSGGKGSSSKRLKKVRKMKDLDHLDDEDLALIQEAQQVDRPDAEETQPQQHAKSVVAKTAEELRKGLFDDDEDAAGGGGGAASSRPAQDRQQVRVERYDEDGMDDFIEDDIGNQGEILASERRAGYEEEDEVNEAQLTEASEIFGADYLDFMEGDQREEEELMGKSRWRERGGGADLGGDESDDDLLSEDEDLFGGDDDDEEDEDGADSGQRAEAIRLKREKRKLAKAERRRQSLVKKAAKRKAQLRRVFEPVQLVENFCTERDDDIRQKDVPERLYDFDTPFYGSDADGLTEQEERQARWIAARIHDVALELSSASMEYEKRRVLESIAAALRFVHRDKLEPAFIRMYRRDYVTSPSVLAKLYEVLDEDGEWNRLNAAMDKVDDLIKDFGKKSSGAVDDDVDLEALEQHRQELKEAQTKAEETAKQESVVKSDLDALGTVDDDDDDDDDELFGDEGDKDEVSQPFPFSSWSLGASISSVRRSYFVLFGHVLFCRRRRRSARA
jgi:transcription elongation factor SPT6